MPVALRSIGPDERAVSDGELLAAIARGDGDALGQLYDRYHQDVWRFACRLTGGGDVDDLVQETFVAVGKAAARYRERASGVRSWIFGVAVNVARHHRRTEARRRRLLEVAAVEPEAPGETPHHEATRREQMRRLNDAMSELSHDLRVPFVMCQIEGVPGPEAASVLGIPEGTLWRRLHQARKALGAALAVEGEV
jgi:RNA polymerase sigma-70 factor (ECF subfamily)